METVGLMIVVIVVLLWLRNRFALAGVLLVTGLVLVVFRARLTTHVFMMVDESIRVPIPDPAAQTTSLCVGLVFSFLGGGLFLIETLRQDRMSANGASGDAPKPLQPAKRRISESVPEPPSFEGIE